MAAPSLTEWLSTRVPAPPSAFRESIEPRRPDVPVSVEALVEEATRALERAELDESAAHDGAFDLLAADAYVTYACEAALEAADADTALARARAVLSG